MDILQSASSFKGSNVDVVEAPAVDLVCPQCLVSILNADQIAAAYGSAALIAARQWVLVASEVVAERYGALSFADWERGNSVVVSLPENFAERQTIGGIAETLLTTIASEPVTCADQSFHVAPALDLRGMAAAAPESGKPGIYDVVPAQAIFGGDAVEDSEEWRARYRRDMAAATSLFADMRAGNLTLATQPICLVRGRRSSEPAAYMYKECLLRRKSGSAVTQQIGLDILAVERLGLARVLDKFVVHTVIDRLEAEPGIRLGANISAQSAVIDSWWIRLCEDLESRRDIADRLVIEITETASISSLPAATEFALKVRGLGCRIAMDDFGVGRDAIRNLTALAPDIVKVDAIFVRRARNSDKDWQALKAIVDLCSALGGVVVAEGIETAADSESAARAGVAWQQGYFISMPSVEPGEAKVRLFHETAPTFGQRCAPVEPSENPVEQMPPDRGTAAVNGTVFRLLWTMPLLIGVGLLIAMAAGAIPR